MSNVATSGRRWRNASPRAIWRCVRNGVRDLGIATKIVAIALVVSSIFAAVGVVGLFNVRDLAGQQDRQYRRDVVALSHMVAVRSAVSAQMESVLSYLITEPGFYRDRFEKIIVRSDEDIDANVARLRDLPLTDRSRRAMDAFSNTVRLWRVARETALDASRMGDQQRAASIVLVRSRATAEAVKTRADEFVKLLVDAVATGARRAQESSRTASQLMLSLLLSGAVLAAGLSVLAARTISRPLRAAVEVLVAVADGDFSQRLPADRNDEVGRLARSLNRTSGILRDAFEQLHYRASHDSLTGLANRSLLRERLTQAMHDSVQGNPLAVMLIDLDGFKGVNDTYGHSAGDRLLVAVAERLSGAVRGEDTVARLGGDEFAVILASLTTPEEADEMTRRLLDAIQTPVELGTVAVTPRASIGITMWQGQAQVDELLHAADLAMYAVKPSRKAAAAVEATLVEAAAVPGLTNRHSTTKREDNVTVRV